MVNILSQLQHLNTMLRLRECKNWQESREASMDKLLKLLVKGNS